MQGQGSSRNKQGECKNKTLHIYTKFNLKTTSQNNKLAVKQVFAKIKFLRLVLCFIYEVLKLQNTPNKNLNKELKTQHTSITVNTLLLP